MIKKAKVIILFVGGVFLNAVAGILNMWGTIAPYIGSYYHHLDNSVYVSDFILVPLISYISATFCTMIVSYLIRCITPFWILIIGTALAISGIFGSSYITEPYLFIWVYGVSAGILSSAIYLPSLWILWNEFPNHKPWTSGIILAGNSFGPVPFSIFFTLIVNPYDFSSETAYKDGLESEQIFGKFVSYRVPMTIRWMAFAILVCSIFGAACLPKIWKNDSNPASSRNPTITFNDMIKSKRVWNLFFMLFTGHSTVSYMFSVYKIIGDYYVGDDHFVTFTGTVSFFLSCFSRILFGFLFEKYYWKRIMVVNYLLTILFLLIFGLCANMRYIYSLCVIVLRCLGTSIYNSILIQTDKDFPYDKWVLSYISIAYIPDYALPYIFEKWLTPIIGYFGSFCVLSSLTGVAILQVIFHPDLIAGMEKKLKDSNQLLA